MIEKVAMAKFRTRIAELVRKAEMGQPTILTQYKRDVAAIVSMAMFERCEKERSMPEPFAKKRNRGSDDRP